MTNKAKCVSLNYPINHNLFLQAVKHRYRINWLQKAGYWLLLPYSWVFLFFTFQVFVQLKKDKSQVLPKQWPVFVVLRFVKSLTLTLKLRISRLPLGRLQSTVHQQIYSQTAGFQFKICFMGWCYQVETTQLLF